MPMLTLNCARCPERKMTHDVLGCAQYLGERGPRYEYFVQCRTCNKTAVWEVAPVNGQHDPSKQMGSQFSLNGVVKIVGLIRPSGTAVQAPEHTPPDIKLIFDEGASCLANGAWNASSAMFRKIVDQISKDKMNSAPDGPPADKRTRFNLKPRLEWLFGNSLLPREVAALADSIREDGNDGVHNTPLGEADALDVQDFTVELLEALYTLPGRLREAEARRALRRGSDIRSGS